MQYVVDAVDLAELLYQARLAKDFLHPNVKIGRPKAEPKGAEMGIDVIISLVAEKLRILGIDPGLSSKDADQLKMSLIREKL